MMKAYSTYPLFILALLLVSCGKELSWNKSQGMIWNTVWHATYKGPEDAISAAIDTLKAVESSVSAFDDNSLVSVINRNENGPIDVHFKNVYDMSRKINRLSGGLFDPTLSPLIKAWGFGKGHTPTADTARIESILTYVGIDKTRIENDTLYKSSPEISFNFSAIAKGYGCDRIGEVLKEAGVSDWLVEIGGEIAAAGKSPSGEDWKISVDKPIFNNDSVIHDSQTIIAFTDMGMATSGNYRNFRNDGAISYGHTISPVTGRPIQTDIISATVLAPSSMIADALATAFMAMGSEPAIEINARLHLPVMLVLADSTIWASEQFRNLEIAK